MAADHEGCAVCGARAREGARMSRVVIEGRTLELCRAHGLKAALVLMPEGSAFRARYNPKVWRQIKDFLDALSRTYDAPLINAREWIEDDGFFDSHHLIIPGAITLARRLSREGVLPLLQDWTLGTSPGQMPSLGSGCRK